MAANFPTSPTDGQVYQTPTNLLYQYDGTYQYWKYLPSGELINTSADTVGIIANAAFDQANTAIGRETIWVPVTIIYAGLSSPPAADQMELATNWVNFKILNFDPYVEEYAYFTIKMPKSWNEGTVTARIVWSHSVTVTNFGVGWSLHAYAFSNDDPGDVWFGSIIDITDTGGTANDIYFTDETSAITIGGAPSAEDFVIWRIFRDISNEADNMAIDARLHGVTIYYTTDAATDE